MGLVQPDACSPLVSGQIDDLKDDFHLKSNIAYSSDWPSRP
jgi:hypothetical protein